VLRGMAQVVEHLPSKSKTEFNPSTTKKKKKVNMSETDNAGPVVHIYNSSYSGGRNQEDHSSKSAMGK
jgi:hypothetical protein